MLYQLSYTPPGGSAIYGARRELASRDAMPVVGKHTLGRATGLR